MGGMNHRRPGHYCLHCTTAVVAVTAVVGGAEDIAAVAGELDFVNVPVAVASVVQNIVLAVVVVVEHIVWVGLHLDHLDSDHLACAQDGANLASLTDNRSYHEEENDRFVSLFSFSLVFDYLSYCLHCTDW